MSDRTLKRLHEMGYFPYMTFITSATDRRYLVLHYSVVIIAYSQQVLSMTDLSGTYAICTVGIYLFITKGVANPGGIWDFKVV